MLVRFILTIRDGDGNERTTSTYRAVSETLSLAALIASAQVYANLVDALTDGAIVAARVEFALSTPPAQAPAQGRAQTGLLLVYGAALWRDVLIIPAPHSSLFDAQGPYQGIRVLEQIPAINNGVHVAGYMQGAIRRDGLPAPSGAQFIVGGKIEL